MDYLAIARKWRPSRFEDLVGQEHIVQTLKNAILHNRVSHAYLFSGPRGIGKTSVARIFAKTLRCPNADQGICCNTCPECEAISESRSVDVIEIDGASNNGVEAVRGIRENVAYGASTGLYKIYIIDEVHMLSTSAFNALLKTLEEPPAHIIFIFATTEVQKIPLTILSRCQRYEFRRLNSAQIIESLSQILKSEAIQMSDEGIRTIASYADGSLRDAQSLLDQVLSYYSHQKESELDEAKVVSALGVSQSSAIRNFLKAIADKDTQEILSIIEQTYLGGVDLKHFTERCLEELRLVYLMLLGKPEQTSAAILDISSSHHAELCAIAKAVNLIQTERMAQILHKTAQQLAFSSLPRFVLEMAAIRMSKLDALEQLESQLLAASTSVVAPSATTKPNPNHRNSLPPKSPTASSASPQTTWKTLVESVMKKRPLLGALLTHANFKIQQDGKQKQVHLAFPGGSFYEKQAEENRASITKQLKDFFGQDTVLLLSNEVEKTNSSLEKVRQAEEKAIKKKTLEHPSVVDAKNILGAEIVGISVDT